MERLLKCRFLFDKYVVKREYANESADGEWSLRQLDGSKKNASFKKTEFRDYNERTKSAEPRNKEITMLQSALRVSYTSPNAMHWITELLKWLYDNEGKVCVGAGAIINQLPFPFCFRKGVIQTLGDAAPKQKRTFSGYTESPF